MFENVDGRTTDARVIGILIAHLGAFGSGELKSSVSARPEFLGAIDDPLFEILGVIGKFRGSELFLFIITFCLSMRQY